MFLLFSADPGVHLQNSHSVLHQVNVGSDNRGFWKGTFRFAAVLPYSEFRLLILNLSSLLHISEAAFH